MLFKRKFKIGQQVVCTKEDPEYLTVRLDDVFTVGEVKRNFIGIPGWCSMYFYPKDMFTPVDKFKCKEVDTLIKGLNEGNGVSKKIH